jgi:exodeoxyribonuclease VII large subunit
MVEPRIYSVSALTQKIKILIEETFPSVWVEGEISNYRPHYSGHLYFTLKDKDAQISCVMWRSRASMLTLALQDGIKVKVLANVRLYEKAGRYQLDVILIQAAGIGELQMLFEALKQKLQAEGLFDTKYKKGIPRYAQSVGVITSPTGAAIKDILSVIKRISPSTEVVIRSVKVQGEGAAKEIARAIETFNKFARVDVLIVGRGGGSLEDLWPFNEEIVARAIFESNIPVISAVGHEIDFTIADFVADLRAPTPSAAAEIAVCNDFELREYIFTKKTSIHTYFNQYISELRNDIKNILRSYAFRRPEDIIRQYALRMDELIQRIYQTAKNCMRSKNELVETLEKRLFSLNPENVLGRGYSMIFKDSNLVFSVKNVEIDDKITVKLKDGNLDSKVTDKYI